MDTTLAIVLIAAAVVLIVAIGAVYWYSTRRRQTKTLRKQFGPEYDRTVEMAGDQTQAESELEQRRQRVQRYDLRPLSAAERREYEEAWRKAESRFVDEPSQALNEADRLVIQVVKARGYRSEGTDQVEADLSVWHPQGVEYYRRARRTVIGNERGDATTEALREAMMDFRHIFDELVEDGQHIESSRRDKVESR